MSSSNPALNDKVFEKEIRASGQGGFTPAWGSPADELPPGVFGGGGATLDAASQQPGYAQPGHGQPGSPPPGGPIVSGGDTMRLSGTMSATAILLGILVVAGWFGWQAVQVENVRVLSDGTTSADVSMPPWLFLSWIGGFIVAIVTIFKPKIARFTAPIYAIAEGLLLGAISRFFEIDYSGIVLQAVGLTIGVFTIMLVLFSTGAIKVTNRFRMMVFASTGAIALVYLVTMVVGIFGGSVPLIHDAGPVGIGFSLVVVGIASMNLMLDFDFVQKGIEMRAPRYMEWFAAFGLLVTLVWLYLEILRLLSKLRSN